MGRIIPSWPTAYLRQQRNQSAQLHFVEVAQLFLVDLVDPVGHPLEQIETRSRNPGDDIPSIIAAALPRNQLGLFESIQQPRYVWNLPDEPIADRAAAEPFGLGATQNPKDVVLRRCDPMRLQRGLERMLQQRRRALNAEMCLFLQALERFALFQFDLEV